MTSDEREVRETANGPSSQARVSRDGENEPLALLSETDSSLSGSLSSRSLFSGHRTDNCELRCSVLLTLSSTAVPVRPREALFSNSK